MMTSTYFIIHIPELRFHKSEQVTITAATIVVCNRIPQHLLIPENVDEFLPNILFPLENLNFWCYSTVDLRGFKKDFPLLSTVEVFHHSHRTNTLSLN